MYLGKTDLFCKKRLYSVGSHIVIVKLDGGPVLDNLVEFLSGADEEA